MTEDQIINCFGKHEAKYRAQVQADTWGHLQAEEGKHYGSILFAVSEYNSQGAIIIKDNFKTVESNPWFFEALNEFISNSKFEAGVYNAVGYYKVFKNGNSKIFAKAKKANYIY